MCGISNKQLETIMKQGLAPKAAATPSCFFRDTTEWAMAPTFWFFSIYSQLIISLCSI